MKRKWYSTAIVSLILGLSFSIFSQAWPEELRVGAGAAPTENVLKPIQEPIEKAIGLKLIIVPNGPVEALMDLDKGKVDAGFLRPELF